MTDIKVKTVEAGYAKVYRDGRIIGTVSEAKDGSTRTGTMWTPIAGLTGERLRKGYTRAEAVAILVAWRTEWDARRSARAAR